MRIAPSRFGPWLGRIPLALAIAVARFMPAAAGAAVLVGVGAFRDLGGGGGARGALALGAVLALGALLAARIARYLHLRAGARPAASEWRADLELGLLLLAAAY